MQQLKIKLMPQRWMLLPNLVVVGFLAAIAAYIKFAGLFNADQHYSRVVFLQKLFEESFLPTEPYVGLLADISEILWCSAAVTCLLSYLLVRQLGGALNTQRYLLFSGILLSLFLLDDTFRITLILALSADVPKLVMYSLYGGAVVVYTKLFWQKLATTPYLLLLSALGLLVLSALADVLHLPGLGTPILLEDGTKLLGILNISLYFYQVCQQDVVKSHDISTRRCDLRR